MLEIEKSYIELSNMGAKPDQLRMLLPHSTAAYRASPWKGSFCPP